MLILTYIYIQRHNASFAFSELHELLAIGRLHVGVAFNGGGDS
jgi:hypothetical protein